MGLQKKLMKYLHIQRLNVEKFSCTGLEELCSFVPYKSWCLKSYRKQGPSVSPKKLLCEPFPTINALELGHH